MRAPVTPLPGAVRKYGGVASVIAVAGAAVAMRMQYFAQWPSGYGKTIEFDSANAARSIWINLTGAHQAWQQAWLQGHAGRFIEPPLIQTLTALTYLPDGIERPWTSQIFALTFWFAASAFLFAAVRRLTNWWGGVLALAYILLAPFAVIISKNFQVEPLLVLCFAAVLWYAVRGDVLAGNRIFVAAFLGALAGLAKPGVLLPFVTVLYAASALEHGSIRDRSRVLRFGALMAMFALPALLYAAIVIPGQVGAKLLPQLWWDPNFYIGWAKNVYRIVGIVPLAGAIAGFVLVPRLRLWGLALAVGDIGLGFASTWHTMTHEYYQVPAMVVVAVGLGGLGQWLAEKVGPAAPLRRGVPVAAALAMAVLLTYVVAPHGYLGDTPGRYPDQARLEVVGKKVGAGNWVLAYTEGYGKALSYYGRVLVAAWPTSADEDYQTTIGNKPQTMEERLRGYVADFDPHYFAVTEFTPDSARLVAFLDASYPVVETGPDLKIYDLTSPLKPSLPRSTADAPQP